MRDGGMRREIGFYRREVQKRIENMGFLRDGAV